MHRRRTWFIGGAGLIVCGVLGILRDSLIGLPPAGLIVTVLADAIWAASILVFAIGVGKDGSLVDRRPLGLAALGIVALWPVASTLANVMLEGLLPPLDQGWVVWGYVAILVPLVAGIVATVQIARAGTVPRPWNRAPLAVLATLPSSTAWACWASCSAPLASEYLR